MDMREVTITEYKAFIKKNRAVAFNDNIGGRVVEIPLGGQKHPKVYMPRGFKLESTTVWSFPNRGSWATHRGDYRGNWAPEIPRNLILRYTKPEETVLDQMVGSGTTLVECKLLGRNGIGVDINLAAIMLTRDRLNFQAPVALPTSQKIYLGDARNLTLLKDESIDLIATHPPYVNIIPYSRQRVEGNFSAIRSVCEYLEGMSAVACESFRVLKPGRYCCVLIGDTRRNKHYIPVAFKVMDTFLKAGFILKEDVIKHQWRCKATPYWLKKSVEGNFLLIMHEHLFIMRKPERGERTAPFRESMTY